MRTASRMGGAGGLAWRCLAGALLLGGGCRPGGPAAESTAGGPSAAAPGVEQRSGTDDALQAVAFRLPAGTPADGARIGLAVGEAHTILRTADGGATWRRVVPREEKGDAFFGVAFAASNEAWAVSRSLLLHSADDGATWAPVAKPPGNFYYYGAWSVGPGGLHLIEPPTCGATVYHRPAGVAAWSRLPAPLPRNDYQALHFRDATCGWVVGAAGRMAWTTDGGLAWETGQVPEAPALEQVHVLPSGAGWMRPGHDHGGCLLESGDAGRSWRRRPVGIDPLATLAAMQVLDTRTVLLVVRPAPDESQVLRTRDGGASWETVGRHPARLQALWFADADHGWVVGDGGCIFRYGP